MIKNKYIQVLTFITSFTVTISANAYTSATCGESPDKQTSHFDCCVKPWSEPIIPFWSDSSNRSCAGGISSGECTEISPVKYSGTLTQVCRQKYGDDVVIF